MYDIFWNFENVVILLNLVIFQNLVISDKFLDFCLEVGIPISHEKTLGPCNILEFAGIELDACKMIARLPEDKILKCKLMIEKFGRENDQIPM